MKKIDFSKYKFHASSLHYLMTKSRQKDEPLSETCKTYLQEIYLKEVWGRVKSDREGNKYTQKGIICETDSLELIERVTGKKYFKNKKTFSNDWIVGTPDVIGKELIDVKTSWDLFTFMSVTEDQANKDYYYQIFGYMWLLGVKNATISYCLVNTPQDIIIDEMYRLSFKFPPDQQNQTEKYRNNYIFDDIPENKRIKSYEYIYDEWMVDNIKTRIKNARDYLSKLSL